MSETRIKAHVKWPLNVEKRNQEIKRWEMKNGF
jgi:hypothetical protein